MVRAMRKISLEIITKFCRENGIMAISYQELNSPEGRRTAQDILDNYVLNDCNDTVVGYTKEFIETPWGFRVKFSMGYTWPTWELTK